MLPARLASIRTRFSANWPMATNLKRLEQRVATLSKGQLALLDTVIDTLKQPISAARDESSDVVSADFPVAFGDFLKLHHTLSEDYLDKHRFEAAMVRIYRALGRNASRSGANNPGHDVTVDGAGWSLKTEGGKKIKRDTLHISKFMELGKGRWENEQDLTAMRGRFLRHMAAYDRIFQLRYFRQGLGGVPQGSHSYELVEIPKLLLQEARRGVITMRHESKQNPKPGYCTVSGRGKLRFSLYFDGGTDAATNQALAQRPMPSPRPVDVLVRPL